MGDEERATPEDDSNRELTKKLYATTDAQVWAKEWCRIAAEIRDRGDEIVDEGWMIGWFANAFATQETHDQRANEKAMANAVDVESGDFDFDREEDGTLSLESAVFQALGYASTCWSKIPGGIFESDKAKDAGDKLVKFVNDWAHQ